MKTIGSILTLQCLDGKDQQFKTELENGKQIIFGSRPGNIFINELGNEDGSINVTNYEGQVMFDASHCTVPVAINGNIISKMVLSPPALVLIGDSVWKLAGPARNGHNNISSNSSTVKKHFSSLIGLEELQDFKLKDIFSRVLQKHSLVEMRHYQFLLQENFQHLP